MASSEFVKNIKCIDQAKQMHALQGKVSHGTAGAFCKTKTWDNVPFNICAQRRLRSACAFAQADLSLRCALWTAKDTKFLHAERLYDDLTAMCTFWSESSLNAHVIWHTISCVMANISIFNFWYYFLIFFFIILLAFD